MPGLVGLADDPRGNLGEPPQDSGVGGTQMWRDPGV